MNSPDRPQRSERDARVTGILRALPRAEASPGFTERVMRRLDRPERETAALPMTTLPGRRFAFGALAVVALVALISVGALRVEHNQRRRATEAEIAALNAQSQALAQQLADIRQRAEDTTHVFVAGDDHVEFVVGIGDRGSSTHNRVPDTTQPAGFRPILSREP